LTRTTIRKVASLALYLGLALAPTASLAFPLPAVQSQEASNPTDAKSLQDLVRLTIANELAPSGKASPKHLYLSRKQAAQGVDGKLNVETTQGTAGMLIEKNNHPISDDQMKDEIARLDRLCGNSDELRRRQKQDIEDAEHASRIMQALPDAFLYEFDGTELGTANLGKPGNTLIRLKFRPNPSYSPPSRVEQVLLGMEGNLLIDKEEHRIARIDAVLFREVGFGWGILGHLDKGGTFLVEQSDVGADSWEMTHVRLDFTGKIMMFKTLTIKSDETDSDFRAVPRNTDFAKGIELLKAEQARLQKKEGLDQTVASRNQR
jgi:hypothetical protein